MQQGIKISKIPGLVKLIFQFGKLPIIFNFHDIATE